MERRHGHGRHHHKHRHRNERRRSGDRLEEEHEPLEREYRDQGVDHRVFDRNQRERRLSGSGSQGGSWPPLSVIDDVRSVIRFEDRHQPHRNEVPVVRYQDAPLNGSDVLEARPRSQLCTPPKNRPREEKASNDHQRGPAARDPPAAATPPKAKDLDSRERSKQLSSTRNFKLLVDPVIIRGASKLYRFDGVVPGRDASKNVTSCTDPRSKFLRHRIPSQILELPVPRFRIDDNFVGEPPAIEVTLSNLNDNVDKAFLADLGAKYGEVDDVFVYYHPVTNRHMGFGRIVFSNAVDAAQCVDILNGRSVMGKQVVAIIDPLGRDCQQMYDSMTLEKEVAPEVKAELPDSEAPLENLVKSCNESFLKTDPDPATVKSNEKPALHLPTPNMMLPPPHLRDPTTPSFPYLPNQTPLQSPCIPSIPPLISQADFSLPPPPMESPLPRFHPSLLPPSMRHGPPQPLPRHFMGSPGNFANPMTPPPPVWLQPTRPMPPPLPGAWNHMDVSPDIKSPPITTPDKINSDDKVLNLDDRIEMLLKGNVLAIDLNDEGSDEKKASLADVHFNQLAIDADGGDSPPPVPPGEEDIFINHFIESKSHSKNSLAPHFNLSSKEHMFETVSVPTNPYGSFTHCPSVLHPTPSVVPFHSPSQIVGKFGPPHLPFQHFAGFPPRLGFLPPQFEAHPTSLHFPFPSFPPSTPAQLSPRRSKCEDEPVATKDTATLIEDLALEEVISLLQSTLEKDLIKKITEVLVFNQLERWWEEEEKIYNKKYSNGNVEEVVVEKQTTDSLLNAIIDSRYDRDFNTHNIDLGFRASLPKMPSFRRKLPPQTIRNRVKHSDQNESDEEEMVKQSESDEDYDEPEPLMTIKRRERLRESSSSSSLFSDSDSVKSASQSDSDLSDVEMNSVRTTVAKSDNHESISSFVDLNLLERMRERTPDGRSTPVPGDYWDSSDESSRHGAQKTDVKTTPVLDGPRRAAMEALSVLGLDEFVCDVDFRERSPQKPKLIKPSHTPLFMTLSQTRIIKEIEENIDNEGDAVCQIKSTQQILGDDSSKTDSAEQNQSDCSSKTESADEETSDVKSSVQELPKETVLKPSAYIPIDHCYYKINDVKTQERLASLDHDYAIAIAPVKLKQDSTPPKASTREEEKPVVPETEVAKKPATPPPAKETLEVSKPTKEKKKKDKDKNAVKLVTPKKAVEKIIQKRSKTYRQRDTAQEVMACYEFLTKGLDQEDKNYLQAMYEVLLTDEKETYWLNDVRWVPHPNTDLPLVSPTRHRSHVTGSARTEGFYKVDAREKQKHRHHHNKSRLMPGVMEDPQTFVEPKTYLAASREARSNQRRLLTAFGTDNDSDLLKFNQLKFRKKQLKFGKSEIHDWGLFAMEAIAADEMVIEYVGQKVRCALADFREREYEKRGIGSSYLFRVDAENIVDATYCGNLSRFINHSCDPNCYAKIITIEGKKKIVIYSKRDIVVDEEITYDYKFPIEEEKIKCLCGAVQCKGFLN